MNKDEVTLNKLKSLLYMKMYGEIRQYEDSLKEKSIDYILSSAYELSVKRDLLYMVENEEFDTLQYSVLLELDNTLHTLYNAWIDYSDDLMEQMKSCTELEIVILCPNCK